MNYEENMNKSSMSPKSRGEFENLLQKIGEEISDKE